MPVKRSTISIAASAWIIGVLMGFAIAYFFGHQEPDETVTVVPPKVDLSPMFERLEAEREAERKKKAAELVAIFEDPERDAYVAECMRKFMTKNPNTKIGNQHLNSCGSQYSREKQDQRLRDEYAPANEQ